MDAYVGQIKLVSFAFAPKGWHLCDGTQLQIIQYQALYTLLGTQYGGDGVKTFALPDLRGRAVAGADPSQAPYIQGAIGGTAAVTLVATNFPPHNHNLNASTTNGTVSTASGTIFAKVATPSALNIYAPPSNPAVPLEARSIAVMGGGQAHPNMQPYVTLNYLIALTGAYPPRPN